MVRFQVPSSTPILSILQALFTVWPHQRGNASWYAYLPMREMRFGVRSGSKLCSEFVMVVGRHQLGRDPKRLAEAGDYSPPRGGARL